MISHITQKVKYTPKCIVNGSHGEAKTNTKSVLSNRIISLNEKASRIRNLIAMNDVSSVDKSLFKALTIINEGIIEMKKEEERQNKNTSKNTMEDV
jgi:hypothetical protein